MVFLNHEWPCHSRTMIHELAQEQPLSRPLAPRSTPIETEPQIATGTFRGMWTLHRGVAVSSPGRMHRKKIMKDKLLPEQ